MHPASSSWVSLAGASTSPGCHTGSRLLRHEDSGAGEGRVSRRSSCRSDCRRAVLRLSCVRIGSSTSLVCFEKWFWLISHRPEPDGGEETALGRLDCRQPEDLFGDSSERLADRLQAALGIHEDEDTKGSLAKLFSEVSGQRQLEVVLSLPLPDREALVAEIDLEEATGDPGRGS